VRRFQDAARLNAAHDLQEVRRGHFSHGQFADPWEDVRLEPRDDLVAVALRPPVLPDGVPLAGDRLEGIDRRQPLRFPLLLRPGLRLRGSLRLALLAGIETFGEQPSGGIGPWSKRPFQPRPRGRYCGPYSAKWKINRECLKPDET
jgi:hypothetical protein